jgi:hypothetical protein
MPSRSAAEGSGVRTKYSWGEVGAIGVRTSKFENSPAV